MITARRVTVHVDVGALIDAVLRRRVPSGALSQVTVEGATVRLTRNRAGRWNILNCCRPAQAGPRAADSAAASSSLIPSSSFAISSASPRRRSRRGSRTFPRPETSAGRRRSDSEPASSRRGAASGYLAASPAATTSIRGSWTRISRPRTRTSARGGLT
jgi:hypothetical protein